MKLPPPNMMMVNTTSETVIALSSSLSTSSVPAFEIGGAYFRIGEKFAPRPRQRDLPVHHDVAAMSETQRVERILLHQENGHALLLIDGANDLEDLLDDQRCQPQRRLIQQEQS